MDSNDNRLIYIFCLTDKPPAVNKLSVSDDILSIKVDSLYATIKYVSDNDYSEGNIKANLSNEVWLDRNVREHLRIITAIMLDNAVIPFNFGTIYKSEERLKQFITTYSKDFTDTLLYLKNKEEWSVKVFCNKRTIADNLAFLSKNISDIDAQIKNSTPGKGYILKKKRNEIINKEITSIYNTYSKIIFTTLNRFCEEHQLNIIQPTDNDEIDIDMILNVNFLITSDNIDNVVNASNDMIKEYENIGIRIQLTGPWPPYTFIKIFN